MFAMAQNVHSWCDVRWGRLLGQHWERGLLDRVRPSRTHDLTAQGPCDWHTLQCTSQVPEQGSRPSMLLDPSLSTLGGRTNVSNLGIKPMPISRVDAHLVGAGTFQDSAHPGAPWNWQHQLVISPHG